MNSVIGAALCAAGLVLAASFTGIGAQQPDPQKASAVPVEAPGFTGKTARLDATSYTIGRRLFAPASRNETWHMHTAGQIVFAESGRGRLQIKGQPLRELVPGDTAYIPAAVMHWHGASPDESFTMTFINLGESTTSPGDKLSEAEYLGKL